MFSSKKYKNPRRTSFFIALAILLGITIFLAGCDQNGQEQTASSVPSATASVPTAIPSATASVPTAIPSAGTNDLIMLAINVGRADAILIQTAGRSFLIDTGTKDSVAQLIGALNLRGVRNLDAVFLTHTHGDHTGGLSMLAQAFPIGMLYSAEISQPDKDGNNRISELAKELSQKHMLLKKGDAVAITGGIAFEVIGPIVYNDADDNDNSLVLRLRANGRSILLAGDMQFAEEATLLNSGAPLTADILKVANHGNPDATSDEFAAAVSPAYAIITTDTNADADSANARVLAALNGSHIMVTHDYPVGAQLTIRADGSVQAASPPAVPKTAGIRIVAADPEEQAITVQNDGASADLSGFFMISEKGPDMFMFPQSATLRQGQTAKIITRSPAQADGFLWQNDGKMWKGKKGNAFVLYDRFGNELSRLDMGADE